MSDELSMPLDPVYHLPVTASGDGGDSAAICGTLLTVEPSFMTPNVFLYVEGETPVRHPDKYKWYGLDYRFSRDQLIALLCGLITRKNEPVCHKSAARLFTMHKKHWFLYAWNKYRNFVYPTLSEHLAKSTPDVRWDNQEKMEDVCGPEIWALWIRCRKCYWLYPLLIIFDLETLFGSVTWWWRKDNLSRNHLLVLIVANANMPTPTSWLAKRIAPLTTMVDRWAMHSRVIGEVDTSEGFRRALKMGAYNV